MLSKERPLFYNERDFQLAFGMALNKHFPKRKDIKIRMEFPYPSDENKNTYADIMFLIKNKPTFAIELKFLSKKGLITSTDGEQFNYKKCSKKKRTEDIEEDRERIKKFGKGCVVILSNDKRFIKKGNWHNYANDFFYKID